MRRELSIYLDLLRFSAAVAVLLSHIGMRVLTGGFLWQLQFIGSSAVVVFFVLSGFVIQYCVDQKERNYTAYQVARFARLYSVVLPALILTYIVDRIGVSHNPAAYLPALEKSPALRLAAGFTFLAQCWSWDLTVLSNNPFWSLCYEFWYYQIFAAAVFLKGRKRLLLIALFCLIVGPPILLYFPLWLAGVGAYKASQRFKISRPLAVSFFVLSLLAAVLVVLADRKGVIVRHGGGLLPRNFTPLDYLLALAVAVNIYAAAFAQLPLTRLAKPITACASLTFALYLLHLPLFHMFASLTPAGLSELQRGLVLIAGTIPLVIGLSFITERRKREWQAFFRWLFERLNPTEAVKTR